MIKHENHTLDGLSLSLSAEEGTARGLEHGFDGTLTFKGATVLLVGDMHLSSIFKGAHKDYRANCIHNMQQVLNHVKDLRAVGKKVVLIFMGDLIGVKERNLVRDHAFRKLVNEWFNLLNSLCEDVLAVRGNHDYGVAPEFAILESNGQIKNPKYVDFYNTQGTAHEMRIHFVNCGKAYDVEFELAGTADVPVSNIALGHNDYRIPGVTDFYGDSENSVDVTTLTKWVGIDLLVFGDIHKPFDEVHEFSLTNQPDKSIPAFCLGSPARTSSTETHPDSFVVLFDYVEDSGEWEYQFKIEPFGALPPEEVFVSNFDKDLSASGEAVKEEVVERSKRLAQIIDDITSTSLIIGSPEDQISNFTAVSPRATEIAKEYYTRALSLL